MVNGLVLFTDGGCRPNPGDGGWGIHGYMFSPLLPKKPAGNPNHVLTATGYVPKVVANAAEVKPVEVTPIHYVDGFGSFPDRVSNNIAELTATIVGLQYAFDYDVGSVLILTDSEYVCRGLVGWKGAPPWTAGWERNGWLKADGTEPSNVPEWKQLVQVRNNLINRGVKVEIVWCRSHTDKEKDEDKILGNIMADRLATIGVMTSRSRVSHNALVSTPAEGYWKYTAERHPFLSNRRMYFNTMPDYVRRGEYFLGDHGKDDDMLGKRISDGAYSVVLLENPDETLELIRQHQINIARGADSIMMARLDHLYRSETHREISTYGIAAMPQPSPYRLDLICLDEEPLTREFRPPKLAMRAVESVSELAKQLALYLEGNDSITVTDLTDILYETTQKVVKKIETSNMKLRDTFNVGYAALPVEANYKTPANGVATASITLTLGIDMLDRNALKRLETSLPKVSLISWLESPDVFRYATIIEAGNDKGIWAGVYSNLRVIA